MPWGMIGAAAIGAAANLFGQRKANRINVEEAQKTRDFQAEERRTSWQVAVEDMRRAGINPAVAYSRGGAAVPGGATARVDSETEAGVATALQSLALRKNLKLMDQQIWKEGEQARKAAAEADMAGVDRAMKQGSYSFYFQPNGRPKPALMELLKSEHAQTMAGSARQVSEAELSRLSISERRAISQIFERYGDNAKGLQMALPVILQMLRR